MHSFFFFNDTATTEIYTLSLHDALPISASADNIAAHRRTASSPSMWRTPTTGLPESSCCNSGSAATRSEEHTSELQSRQYLVCRLLLEKKKQTPIYPPHLFTVPHTHGHT